MIDEDFESTEELRYRGEAEASDIEKKDVGGEKTLAITNHLFQSDAICQAMAEMLLERLKGRKDYFEASNEFCPMPIERRDVVTIEEYVTHEKSIWHTGIVRQVKLSVTPSSQSLTLILEGK